MSEHMEHIENMTKIGVFMALPGRVSEGYQRVGGFELDPTTGVAILTVTDESQRAQLEQFATGIAARPNTPTRYPQDGPDYLSAIRDTFRGSSYLRIIDETPGAEQGE
jgi:hypothetical protein